MLILGQVSLIKGYLCPAGMEKGKNCAPQELEKGKNLKQIFNNSRSSIKSGSVPDPNIL